MSETQQYLSSRRRGVHEGAAQERAMRRQASAATVRVRAMRQDPARPGEATARPAQATARPGEAGYVDWRDRAACRDAEHDLFFPIGTTGPALAQIKRAKQICGGCPVREPCLEWALKTGEDSGIWGGKTGEERRALRYLRKVPGPRRRPVI